MAKKDESGNWINRNGRPVKPEHINKVTKRRDTTVEKIIKKAMKLENTIRKTKADILNEVQKYMQYVEVNSGAIDEDASCESSSFKGNIQLTDYSGLQQIEVSVNDTIEFDERLLVAKGLIDKCLTKWSDGSNENIKSVISEAFNTDKQGKVNKYMIIRLTKIEIKDPDWKKAVTLILESQNVKGSRQYVNLRMRDNKDDKFKTINLNFSSL